MKVYFLEKILSYLFMNKITIDIQMLTHVIHSDVH